MTKAQLNSLVDFTIREFKILKIIFILGVIVAIINNMIISLMSSI